MKRSVFTVMVIVIFSAQVQLFAAGDAAAGKDAYMKKCASCHGQAGEGKDAIAAMMKVKLTHLGVAEVQTKSDVDLKKISVEGTGKMKPVKDIDAKMAEDIVAFMRTLAKK